MTTVYQYRIYCNTEATWKYVWDTEEPSKCPSSDSHSVNLNSIMIINVIKDDEVVIKQEKTPTGGRLRVSTIDFIVEPSTTGILTKSFPINLTMLGTSSKTQDSQENDNLSVHIAPNTTIGAITSPCDNGATSIIVSSTVITNIFVGGFINLFNGSISSNDSQVISIDSSTNTLTLETTLNNSFSAGSEVRLTVYLVDNIRIGLAGNRVIGENMMIGRYIPANTVIKFIYTNNSTISQHPTLALQYLY